MIDASHCKVNHRSAGTSEGNQGMSHTKMSISTMVHLVKDAHDIPRKNRKSPRSYDKALYKLHHLVESTFMRLKR